jgi:hypothetical protein
VAVHLNFSHDAKVEGVRYLAQKRALLAATRFVVRQPAPLFSRCFAGELGRALIQFSRCFFRSAGGSGRPSRSSLRRYGSPSSITVSQALPSVDFTLPPESKCRSEERASQV